MLDIEFLRYLVRQTKDSGAELVQCAKKLEASLWSNNNRLIVWNVLKQNTMPLDLRMQWACLLGLVDQVQLLIEQGADVNSVDYSYSEITPLMIATLNNHPQTVSLLISNRAKLNKAGAGGATAIYLAAGCGYSGLVKLLHSHGADLNKRSYGENILSYASSYGHYDIVRFLLRQGIDVNEENLHNTISLHGAAYNGHYEVAALLIRRGSAVSKPAINGLTPLHSATLGGHTAIMKLLIANGAQVNLATVYEEETPVHIAASRGFLDALKLLVKVGADVNKGDVKGLPPLHSAVMNGHVSVVCYLLEHGACSSLYALSRVGLYKNNTAPAWSSLPWQLRGVLIKAIKQSTTLFSLDPFPEYFTAKDQKEILSIFKRNKKIEWYYHRTCQLIDQSLSLYTKAALTKDQMGLLSKGVTKLKQRIKNLSPTASQLNRIDEYFEFKQVVVCYCLQNTPEDAIEYLNEISDHSANEIQETIKFLVVHCFGDYANWQTNEQKRYYLSKIIGELFVHIQEFDTDLSRILAYGFWHLLHPNDLDNPGLTLSLLWEQSEVDELKKLPVHYVVLGARVLLQTTQNVTVLTKTIDMLIDITTPGENQALVEKLLLTSFIQLFIKLQKLSNKSSISTFEELCTNLPSQPFLRKNSSVIDKRKVVIEYYKNITAAAPSIATISLFDRAEVTKQEQYQVEQLCL